MSNVSALLNFMAQNTITLLIPFYLQQLFGAIFTSSHKWLTTLLKNKGFSGGQLEKDVFMGAFHITYMIGVLFAVIVVITFLVRGSTINRH